MAIFNGRTNIPYNYSRYGYTRGNGKVWHGGLDLVGIDDDIIRMPDYKGKTITGTVVQARIVLDGYNRTWEWGYYVSVKLDANQTDDLVNWMYFCHCSKLLVKRGQKVKTGDALAVMGNTGNAAFNNPPYKHCHFEVRATATGRGLDPCAYSGTSNAVGIYGTEQSSNSNTKTQTITIGPVSNGDAMHIYNLCKSLGLTDNGLYNARYN